jgi:RHS repeat-associated protein
VLGGAMMAEVDGSPELVDCLSWRRGYVYTHGGLLAIQQGGVKRVHQDPVVKSQRLMDYNQTMLAVLEVDPWGGETARSWQSAQQPRKYTTYERDGSGNDQAMYRQYHSYWQRFDQPDPYDGSANLTDPQSLNRYAYVQNDPVNFVDPTGLDGIVIDTGPPVTVIGNVSGSIGNSMAGLGVLEGSPLDAILEVTIGEGMNEGDPPQTERQPKRDLIREDLRAYDDCIKAAKDRFMQSRANLFNPKKIATEAAWAAGLGATGEGIVKGSLRVIGWKVVAVSVGLDVVKNVGQDIVSNQSAILARNNEDDECKRSHPASASFRIYGTFSRQEQFRR